MTIWRRSCEMRNISGSSQPMLHEMCESRNVSVVPVAARAPATRARIKPVRPGTPTHPHPHPHPRTHPHIHTIHRQTHIHTMYRHIHTHGTCNEGAAICIHTLRVAKYRALAPTVVFHRQLVDYPRMLLPHQFRLVLHPTRIGFVTSCSGRVLKWVRKMHAFCERI